MERYEALIREVITERIADWEVRKDDSNGCVVFVLLMSGELVRVDEIPAHRTSGWCSRWIDREVVRQSIA